MDRTDKIAMAMIVTVVLALTMIQIGMYRGRSMERRDGEERTVREIASLLRTDGYTGQLVYEDGQIRIVHPRPSFKLIRARAEAVEARR